MTTQKRLAAALVKTVTERLDRGHGFVWLPELVTPMPVAQLLDELFAREGVLVGVLIEGAEVDHERARTDVPSIIDWRNDASVRDPIVIVGNLERDRAAGLSDIRPVQLSEVRRQLFSSLIDELKQGGVPLPAIRFLSVLAESDVLLDLVACSEYAEGLLPVGPTTAERSKLSLWRLGLLPDGRATEIDRRRLNANHQTIIKLRSMEASTRQRLIHHLNQNSANRIDYAALRTFTTTGDTQYLSDLDLELVQEALKSTGKDGKKAKKNSKKDQKDDPDASTVINDLIQSISEDKYREEDFLEQVQRDDQSKSSDHKKVSVDGSSLEWEFENLHDSSDLLTDPNDDVGYEAQAGSVELIRPDEPFPVPGKGDIKWRSLENIARRLQLLETRAQGTGASPDEIIRRVVALRQDLVPFLDSIPNEGARLFMLSAKARETAEVLVETWVELWEAMVQLRSRLNPEDHVYVRSMAEELASTDLRITRHGSNVEAYVLPLHPVVLEPRVRAAELFLADDDVSDDFFELVNGSLDPSVPSISVLLDGAPYSLGFAGSHKGVLRYSKDSRQGDSADVDRTLREIVQRFVNVHPYASLSLSVGLLDPSPKTAKNLLKWLGGDIADRVSLSAYTRRRDSEDVRAALDQAKEELLSGEVSPASFEFDVVTIHDLAEFPTVLRAGEQLPHLLFTFDLGDVDQASAGFKFSAQPLGSLVSEWTFDTNPLEESRPVIRPRTGSNQLTKYLTTQAGILEVPLPSQQRSPLLPPATETAVEELGELATWVVLCEGVSALVPPTNLGDLQLVGRMGSGNHVAFVYSAHVTLLLEPVVKYLWTVAWIDPDRQTVLEFLLGTIRMALPEGLLGFFKARGSLSKESVLGKLGFAAALAFLNEEDSGRQLIVSLDTEGARRWLGLRSGKERRADLLVFTMHPHGKWDIEAIEVKARTDTTNWVNSPPEAIQTALEQVREMHRLLEEVFDRVPGDPFTPSRREILKRQVFLEAFQQWEYLRLEDESKYAEQIRALNMLFDGQVGEISRRVLLVSPNHDGDAEMRTVRDGDAEVPTVTLGVPWLRRAVDQKPGASVEIPTGLLDELGLVDDSASLGDEDDPLDDHSAPRPDPFPSGSQSTTPDDTPRSSERSPDPEREPPALSSVDTVEAADIEALTNRLREVFVARNAPFRSIDKDAIVRGPTVVQVPFTVPVGAKLSQIVSQETDIARDLGVQSIRISNWPGQSGYAVAEVPRANRDIPDVATLRRPTDANEYPVVAIGAQLDYNPSWVSLDEMPHLLVAGTTGSGKSVFLRSLLWQLTRLYSEDEIDLVVIDAKGMADYLDFSGSAHFKMSEHFHSGVAGALDLLEDIVERQLPERREIFTKYATDALRREAPVQVTNLRQLLADHRARNEPPLLRPLVVFIDEFAELVLGTTERRQFEKAVTRFVSVARAIGGHLVAATQRPSTDVVTGVMKANFARVALRVQQSVDSRVILDENGAETLLGRGDLLYKSSTTGLQRLQGYSAVGPYLA